MELQFYKKEIPCMRPVINQTMQQELTQEIKLPDDMPEIGRVIGAWGQVLVRSKQWHSSSLEASCGVMAKVLYLSETDGHPCCVEAWVPFQVQSEFPKEDRDGKFNLSCSLRFADARSVSARKIMYRAGVTSVIDAYVPENTPVFLAENVPENIHVLKRMYPVCVLSELGEKTFAIDELLTLPAACPPVKKIVYCALRPEIIDKKILAEKIVFRGIVVLSVFYCTEDGNFCSYDFEIPFSQYQELDREYDENTIVDVVLMATGLDVDVTEDGRLSLKAGILAQYTICGSHMTEIVEDAFCSTHESVIEKMPLQLRSVLDVQNETMRIEVPIQADVMRVVDVTCCCDGVELKRTADAADMNVSCRYQVLYYGTDGSLQCEIACGQARWTLPAADDAELFANVLQTGKPQCISTGSGISAQNDVSITAMTRAVNELLMVSQIQTTDVLPVDPDRPGLVICRTGETGIWDIAKKYKSSPEKILSANHLDAEPERGRILIIPMN